MTSALRDPWTTERFLAWEDRQEGRHEFDGQQVIEMTGGSRNHQRIIANLLRLLDDALDPERFEPLAEMRVRVGNQVRYPDVSVVLAPVPGTLRTLDDAVVLFEVASSDSSRTDLGDKTDVYARVPGLRRYIVLEQSAPAATVLVRTAHGWSTCREHVTLDLPELGVNLQVSDVYHGVRWR